MDAIAPHFDPAKAPLPAALKEELVSRKLHLSPCRLLATYIISTLMTGTGRSTIEDSRVLRRQFNLHESWPPGVLLTKTHNFLVRRLQNFGEGSRQNCWVVPIPQHMLQC